MCRFFYRASRPLRKDESRVEWPKLFFRCGEQNVLHRGAKIEFVWYCEHQRRKSGLPVARLCADQSIEI
jgi:hypothetical protein